MLTKFETKSNRVKGLAFHPKRPWVLSTLHSGSIQLWDYRMGTLIDRFEEHEGPVRGIDFHPTQPLFVSGGDDYKIKIWNYKLRRCLFTLMGHLDYIRTVYFHKEHPWIVSASDDQTVRIWNWQNRSCLAVLTGHNHYVMCASFHPYEDLVVSAALDQTLRVWDLSALRQKSVKAPGGPGSSSGGGGGLEGMSNSMRSQLPAAVNADLFGSSEVTVKYVLEGHSRGVNWAQFHPTLPLIISGADDRLIKLWRMSETKAWEVDVFRGHFNNVSCVMFHPKLDLVISNSEDKTIRVWDLNRRTCLYTFRRDSDRFWILAVHPTLNLIASGHDSGMLVFKLERERPAFNALSDRLIYVKDRYARALDFDNGRDTPMFALAGKQGGASGSGSGLDSMMGDFGGMVSSGGAARPIKARSMSYNAQENAILLNYDAEGGSYELYVVPKGSGSGGENVVEPRRGFGSCAVFVGRNRFASLEQGKTVVVRDLHNEVTKRVPVMLPGADMMYVAGPGFVLLRNEETVAMQDLQQRKITAQVSASSVRYVVWSEDMNRVALLGKHVLLICSRKLEVLATIHESIRIKSAAWDDSGVLLYTTLNHLKYCLPNGDNGIVSTLENTIYITRVRGPAVCYLDREGNPGLMPIDPSEFTFKLLLLRKRYDDVKRMIAESRLPGQAIIAYLQKKGFPEVALHFVRDETTRFALAVDSGSVEVALESAKVLDRPDAWNRLADVALAQGNVDVVEMCLQKTKSLEKLAFLYVLLGDFERLRKMAQIAENAGNYMAVFQIMMYLGDYEGMTRVLASCAQVPLGKLCARSHGLDELADELVGEEGASIPHAPQQQQLMMPPIPIGASENWPLLQISRGMFKRDPNSQGEFEEPALDYYEDAATFAESERDGFLDDENYVGRKTATAAPVLDPFAKELEQQAATSKAEGGGGGWGDDDFDLDLPVDLPGAAAPSLGAEGDGLEPQEDEYGRVADTETDHSVYYVPPKAGVGIEARWTRSSKLPGELVAAGAFDEAMKLLARQVGACMFGPMKEIMSSVYLGCRGATPASMNTRSNALFVKSALGPDRPYCMLTLPFVKERFSAGAQLFTQGKFSDALAVFAKLLLCIPLVVVGTMEDVNEVKATLGLCREYVMGLLLEQQQRKAKADGNAAAQMQLSALFTHCKLAPAHAQLTLRAAMGAAYSTKNFIFASGFARRLLDSSPKPDLAASARKMIQFCDQNMSNACEIDYDDRRDFVLNMGTLQPLYTGSPRDECPLCAAQYSPEFKSTVCVVCKVAKVGASAEGLRISTVQMR
ncbi:Coatomer subunit alpha [Porphyridium purpureum]|uniref:Coatomer subunit alpha n=1 Tax=Porphyridium purpureum TaxID=35688 RepID=A0A5J4YKQ3_PORPP|nr:Coatomer subunit alpha [Porphyridium purpureum]|eukprot:POR2770..scf244_11